MFRRRPRTSRRAVFAVRVRVLGVVVGVLLAFMTPWNTRYVAAAARMTAGGVLQDQHIEFHHLLSTLYLRDSPASLVLVQANHRASVVVNNGEVVALKGVNIPIPNSPWFLSGMPGANQLVATWSLSGSSGKRYGSLPSCASNLGFQILPQAVAYWCGPYLDILRLPKTVRPILSSDTREYRLRGAPPSGVYANYAVNTTGTMVAVEGFRGRVGGLRIYSLLTGSTYPGDLPVAPYPLMSWSRNGVLAVVGPGGTYLWRPGGGVRRFPTSRGARELNWLANAKEALLLTKTGSGLPSYTLYALNMDGRSKILMRGHLGYVLGLDPDAMLLWREEGVARSVYDCSAASAPCGGTGPFTLMAIPIP